MCAELGRYILSNTILTCRHAYWSWSSISLIMYLLVKPMVTLQDTIEDTVVLSASTTTINTAVLIASIQCSGATHFSSNSRTYKLFFVAALLREQTGRVLIHTSTISDALQPFLPAAGGGPSVHAEIWLSEAPRCDLEMQGDR